MLVYSYYDRADLAEVPELAGRPHEATALLHEALGRCERKSRKASKSDGSRGAWRATQALVDAARSRHTEAEQLARDAAARAERTDSLWLQGDALDNRAEVLDAGEKRDEAIAVWREALDRYERKQIIPLARRVRERLAALQETPR